MMQGQLPADWSRPQKWRYRCPQGHTNLQPTASRERAWCLSCLEAYSLKEIEDQTSETTRFRIEDEVAESVGEVPDWAEAVAARLGVATVR